MKRAGKAFLGVLAALAFGWLLTSDDFSITFKLSTAIGLISLGVVYETATLKEAIGNLEYRLDILERDLRERNFID